MGQKKDAQKEGGAMRNSETVSFSTCAFDFLVRVTDWLTFELQVRIRHAIVYALPAGKVWGPENEECVSSISCYCV